MPKERARDPDQWPVGILHSALLDDVERRRVDNDLVQTSFDEPTGEVLDLLACLDEEVPAGRDLDRDALARVAGPDVQAWVARAAVNRQEVEVGVEPREDCVPLAIFDQVRGSRCEEVWAVYTSC